MSHVSSCLMDGYKTKIVRDENLPNMQVSSFQMPDTRHRSIGCRSVYTSPIAVQSMLVSTDAGQTISALQDCMLNRSTSVPPHAGRSIYRLSQTTLVVSAHSYSKQDGIPTAITDTTSSSKKKCGISSNRNFVAIEF